MSGEMKKFVSEKDVEEARKKRQEEWEKARQSRPDLPNPDEVETSKTLYEQLQLNKQKKEEEFLESKKFKNQIRGLDNEESQYLDQVSRKQMQEEKQRLKEQEELILEMKKEQKLSVTNLPVPSADTAKSSEKPKQMPAANKSIGSLVKNAVKRKPEVSQPSGPPEKQSNGTSNE